MTNSLVSALQVREVDGTYRDASSDEVVRAARRVLASRTRAGVTLSSPAAVKDYLRLRIGFLEHEVFGCVFLDSQHKIIAFKELFRGTLSQTSVYPREVLKECLQLNAGALVLWHNHPSHCDKVSRADEMLTQTLVAALRIIDVRVLDHLVVAGDEIASFAEQGLL